MKDSEIAYLAGLFDGEGSVMYKQYLEKRKNRPNPMFCWRIRLDVAMTDKNTIKHIYDTLMVRFHTEVAPIPDFGRGDIRVVDFFG